MYCWIEDTILGGMQAYKGVKYITFLLKSLQKHADLNRNARIKKLYCTTQQYRMFSIGEVINGQVRSRYNKCCKACVISLYLE